MKSDALNASTFSTHTEVQPLPTGRKPLALALNCTDPRRVLEHHRIRVTETFNSTETSEDSENTYIPSQL